MTSYDGLIFNTKDVKSVSVIGVIKALMEADTYNSIKYFGGIHTGALIALLCVLRFNLEEIKNIVCAFDFKKVYSEQNQTLFNKIFKRKCSRKKYIQNFVDSILSNRFNREGSLTFADLYTLSFKHLKFVATNITKHKPFYMDYIHTPNMPVYLAVCIAIQDPCVSPPVWYEGQQYIGGKITAQHNVFKNMYHLRFLVIVTSNNKKRKCVYSKKDYVKGVIESMRRYSDSVQVLEPNEHICSISFTKLDCDIHVEKYKKHIKRHFELLVNYGMFAFKRFVLDLSPLGLVVSNSRDPSLESSAGDSLAQKVQEKRRSLEIMRNSIESEILLYNA